jgi:hypothetical protein
MVVIIIIETFPKIDNFNSLVEYFEEMQDYSIC